MLKDEVQGSMPPLTYLRWTLFIVGAGWTAFFVVFVPIVLFDPIDHQSTAGRLLLWGHGGVEYLAMITAINLVVGIALMRAATDPRAHAESIDLCLAINVAHMATMAVMAAAGTDHHQHLAGDVALGIISTLALAVAWLPVRGRVRSPGNTLDPDQGVSRSGFPGPQGSVG